MGNLCNGKVEGKDKNSISDRQNIIYNTINRDVWDYYEKEKILGEGSMGTVSCVRKKDWAVGGSAYKEPKQNRKKFHLLSRYGKKPNAPSIVISQSLNKRYALKSITLSRISPAFISELKNEISILKTLDHPNIVKAYEVYESKRNIELVMENCSGGDLHTRAPYSEMDAAKIIGKLLSAIVYMHEKNIVHRDLKFENIMFENRLPDAEIKLIDFGLSKKCSKSGQAMSETYGTMYTMSPQVIRGHYNSQADLWAIGVITYMLLSHEKPFNATDRYALVTQILTGDYTFNEKTWKDLSPQSKIFVMELLVADERTRLNAKKAISHDWLNLKFSLEDRKERKSLMTSVENQLFLYSELNDFKKIALTVIAHNSTTEEIDNLRNVFECVRFL